MNGWMEFLRNTKSEESETRGAKTCHVHRQPGHKLSVPPNTHLASLCASNTRYHASTTSTGSKNRYEAGEKKTV